MNSLEEVYNAFKSAYDTRASQLTFNTISYDMKILNRYNSIIERTKYAIGLKNQLNNLNISIIDSGFSCNTYVYTTSYSTYGFETNALACVNFIIRDIETTFIRNNTINQLNRIKNTKEILGENSRDLFDVKLDDLKNTLNYISFLIANVNDI